MCFPELWIDLKKTADHADAARRCRSQARDLHRKPFGLAQRLVANAPSRIAAALELLGKGERFETIIQYPELFLS